MSDPVSWCQKNWMLCLVGVLLVLCVTGHLQPLLHEVMSFVGVEGFRGLSHDPAAHPDLGPHPVAAEEGEQEGQLAVKGIRTPATCYPQGTLKPEDLLPEDESNAIQEFNSMKPAADGIMQVSLLEAGQHVGVNTVGQSLRNANLQLRSEPPNPQVNVSPWQNTTIGPDLIRRPLEINESCSQQQ